jgi:hypothetical protein
LLLFKISFGFQVKYSVFWALFGGWRTSIIVIEFDLFWPVSTSANNDGQTVTIANNANGIGHFSTSLMFPCPSMC